MREIKFRAWDKNEKIMLEDICTNTDDFTDMLNETFRYWKNPELSAQLEIMQYTGLKDKNEKEIYEGDILKLLTHYPPDYQERNPHKKYGRIFGPVIWEDGWLYSDKKERNKIEDELLYKENVDQFEIIGNIYENSELLK